MTKRSSFLHCRR